MWLIEKDGRALHGRESLILQKGQHLSILHLILDSQRFQCIKCLCDFFITKCNPVFRNQRGKKRAKRPRLTADYIGRLRRPLLKAQITITHPFWGDWFSPSRESSQC
jgi:hypothetical protein